MRDSSVLPCWACCCGLASPASCTASGAVHCGQPCLRMSIWAKEQTSPTPTTSTVKLRRKSTISGARWRSTQHSTKGVTRGLSSSSSRCTALYWNRCANSSLTA
uniref:Putative secreted protein n=1 Tax=Ixodes ricinus TaxID=34613 RepID=A0A147BQ09_IXORI